MNRDIIITGIGSRETPDHILAAMKEIGRSIAAAHGWVRSGHADGADWAFERGAGDRTIAYLPWEGFNSEKPLLGKSKVITGKESPLLRNLVIRYHPSAKSLKQGAYKLMLRNGAQILGAKCNQPSDVVVAFAEETGKGQWKGGTGQALRIAYNYRIPIINMWDEEYKSAEAVIDRINEIWSIKNSDDDIHFVVEHRPVYGWMSNFTKLPILWEHPSLGYQEWPSTEHAYQAAKTEDAEKAEEIRLAATPKKARDLGQAFERHPDAVGIMEEIVRSKFEIPALKAMLLETGDRKLVEDAYWDGFWGWGREKDGQNHLGQIIMRIRDDLRSTVSSS